MALSLNIVLAPASVSYANGSSRGARGAKKQSTAKHKRSVMKEAANRYLRMKGKHKKSKRKWGKKSFVWTGVISFALITPISAAIILGSRASAGLLASVVSSVFIGAVASAPLAVMGGIGGIALAGGANLLRKAKINRMVNRTEKNRTSRSIDRSIDSMIDTTENMLKEGTKQASNKTTEKNQPPIDPYLNGSYSSDPLNEQ